MTWLSTYFFDIEFRLVIRSAQISQNVETEMDCTSHKTSYSAEISHASIAKEIH